jgi:hypothetical protein
MLYIFVEESNPSQKLFIVQTAARYAGTTLRHGSTHALGPIKIPTHPPSSETMEVPTIIRICTATTVLRDVFVSNALLEVEAPA